MHWGAILSAVAAFAGTGAMLQPTSKWNVDYGNDVCRLTREFGSSSKPVIVDFEAPPMGHGLNVNFFDSRLSVEEGKSLLRVQILPDPATLVLDGFTISVGNQAIAKTSFTLDEEVLPRLASASAMSIARRDSRPVVLSLPGLQAALRALEECRVDLVASWGMPLAEQSRLKVPPKLDPRLAKRGVFNTDDYPASALRENAQGATTARIDVAADGQPLRCTVIRSSGHAGLDSATCAVILKRAHYIAASGQDGHPMKSIDVVKIQWVLPSDRPVTQLAPRPALDNPPAPLTPQ